MSKLDRDLIRCEIGMYAALVITFCADARWEQWAGLVFALVCIMERHMIRKQLRIIGDE